MNGNTDDDSRFGVRGSDGGVVGLDDDGVYRAMTDRSRRRVLAHLLDRTESTVDELATVLVGWDATERKSTTTTNERRARRIELHHHHLPLLAEVGLVDFDPGTGAVELADVGPGVRDLVARSVAAES